MGQRIKDRALAAMARGDLQGGQFSTTTGKQSNKSKQEATMVKNRQGESVELKKNEKLDEYGDVRKMTKQEQIDRDVEAVDTARRQLQFEGYFVFI